MSGQFVRERPYKFGQLAREVAVAIEGQMPPIARVAPVTNVGDAPVRHRFDVDYKIDASAVVAVDETPAEDHLTMPAGGTRLAGCEAKWLQDRVKDDCNSMDPRI